MKNKILNIESEPYEETVCSVRLMVRTWLFQSQDAGFNSRTEYK